MTKMMQAGLLIAALGWTGPLQASEDFWIGAGRSISAEKRAPQAPAGIKIPIFKDSDFPFVTIVPDDGTDKGGGYQETKVNLPFYKVIFPVKVISWTCPITIGMPLRTEKMGKIPPSLAATMSSGITNMVTINMNFDFPQGIFFGRFVTAIDVTFKATYPNLGSSVRKW